jgi:hypothetical protein
LLSSSPIIRTVTRSKDSYDGFITRQFLRTLLAGVFIQYALTQLEFMTRKGVAAKVNLTIVEKYFQFWIRKLESKVCFCEEGRNL